MADDQYFNHYGLKKDPFSVITDDREFFSTPALEHRIELIKHLIEFSDRIVVVTGDAGSGKTSLLSHLKQNSDEKWNLCQLQFNDINTVEDFFFQLFQDQGIDYNELDSYGNKIATLYEYFEDLELKGYLPLLFIDDAHYLSIEILKALFDLAINQKNKPALHIVLFSETNIAELINHRNLGFIHSLDLPPFDEEQIADYISHRLMTSGHQGDSIIDQKLISSIYKTSNGLPGLINELAIKALQDPAIENKKQKPLVKFKALALNPNYTLPLALILITAFIVYTLQSDNTEQDVEVVTKEIDIPIQTTETQPNTQAEEAVSVIEETSETELETAFSDPESQAKSETETPDIQEPNIVLLNTDGEIIYDFAAEPKPDQAKTETEENNIEILTEKITDTKESVIEQSENMIESKDRLSQKKEQQPDKVTAEKTQSPEPVTRAEQQTPPEPEEKTSTADTETSVKKQEIQDVSISEQIRGADWLKQQPPNHYVLQLMGVHDGNALSKFIDKNIPNKQHLALFTTVNQNKEWHVLVYGNYANRELAVNAIPTLPSALQKLNPWPRRVETIQSDLR